MATRAYICRENDDNTYSVLYLHHDGSVNFAGKTLLNNYQSKDEVDKLFNIKKDLKSLHKNIDDSTFFEDGYYDYNFSLSSLNEMFDEYEGMEYSYLFDKNNEWYVKSKTYDYIKLSDKIKELGVQNG